MARNYTLSPSLFVGNLMNLQEDIRQLDEAGAELLHIDMIDTSFSDTTGMPPCMIPMIREATNTTLDIHLMSSEPTRYLPLLLPYIKGSYLALHIEVAKEFNWLASEIREAGGKPAVALNSTTPISAIEEVLKSVDMVEVMMMDASRSMKIPGMKERMYDKVARVRKMCKQAGVPKMMIQCDGGITFEMAKNLLKSGADSFVLGRDSIYMQKESLGERIQMLRAYLDEA